MKPPEKLRELAIQLHTLKVAEGLDNIETTLTHHWRDAQDEPQERKCQIKLSKDQLLITWTVDRQWTTVYQGPVSWLYGVHRYEEET